MKKLLSLSILILMMFVLNACEVNNDPVEEETSYLEYNPKETDGLILEEQERSFMFFWETSNKTVGSPGYGMSRDRFPGADGIASVASVGYALASLPIAVNNEWITYDEAKTHASMTLDTLKTMDRHEGFFFHFVYMDDAKRAWDSEVSVIDTALLIAGALVAGQFFGDEVFEKASEIYQEINWNWYINPNTSRFYMEYRPENGFHTGAWNGFAEQLIMYVLGAGSPTYPTGTAPYSVMKFDMIGKNAPYVSDKDESRNVESFFYTHGGELFIHQYSHAFIDFRNILDADGFDWFENAKRAHQAQYSFALDYQDRYRSVHRNSFGVSASDGPNGYFAYGTPPYGHTGTLRFDGTVAPYAAMASIIHLEEETINSAYFFKSMPELWSGYGFRAAFNLSTHTGFSDSRVADFDRYFSPDVIGIDKGITALMIENYRSSLIWDIFMDIPYIQDGLDILGFYEK